MRPNHKFKKAYATGRGVGRGRIERTEKFLSHRIYFSILLNSTLWRVFISTSRGGPTQCFTTIVASFLRRYIPDAPTRSPLRAAPRHTMTTRLWRAFAAFLPPTDNDDIGSRKNPPAVSACARSFDLQECLSFFLSSFHSM